MGSTISMNNMQQEAVLQTKGPVLILAGAGSGKTRVLINRIAYLIDECNVNPYNIMAITFTNKAAKEMRQRVDDTIGFGSESIWVSTFHSSCVRILRRHIDEIGYDNRFTIYDSDDSKTLMKDICKKLNIDTKKYKEKSILNQISKAKDELISPEQFELNASGDYGLKKISQCYKEYEDALKKNNALDFDDLIVKTVELFKKCPDVLENYQERFKYIMVDEYQDTNTAQFMLVALLAGKYQNICVVGDDDQSIYKFRGANIGNILNFEKIFPGAKIIKLEQNYRSTKNILEAANNVIQNNRERKSKKLWTDNEQGDKIKFLQLDNAYDEADYIAHDLKNRVEQKGQTNYKDCACLYRTNAQSRILEEKFIILNIPYRIVGGVNFYQRKEVKDILAYLKTIDNGKDEIACKRIINVPKRGIGLTTIGKISDYSYEHNMTFYEALKESQLAGAGRASEKINKFVDLIQNFRGKSNFLSLEELINDVIDTTGYVSDLEAENTDEAKDRILNINELVSKVVDYEKAAIEEGNKPELSQFLEEVALIADIDRLDVDSDFVTLMTVHSAKGLEFENVYLTGMEDGLFPSYMTITSDDKDDLEEERRLCYVAITRAKKYLTITSAKMRMLRGEPQINKVSRFVREIDLELLDTSKFGHVIEKKEVPMFKKETTQGMTFTRKPFQTGNITKSFGNNNFNLDYKEGDRVSHTKFGNGTVLKIVSGGRDYEVTVEFDKCGVKKMFAMFAKLKPIQ